MFSPPLQLASDARTNYSSFDFIAIKNKLALNTLVVRVVDQPISEAY